MQEKKMIDELTNVHLLPMSAKLWSLSPEKKIIANTSQVKRYKSDAYYNRRFYKLISRK